MSKNVIELFPDAVALRLGLVKYIALDFEKYPHLAVFGATGSGKTVSTKLILARCSLHIDNAELIICDFKADDDFSFLQGKKHFYRFSDCINGLELTLSILRDRQQKPSSSRHFVMLFFDEWASFIASLDKKEAEKAKSILATLLMLGRSFNIHVCIAQQRLDATAFPNGARDNFNTVIGLGKLSKESVQMIFSEYKEVINPDKGRGEGSAIIGNKLYELVVPQIHEMEQINKAILSIVP